MKNLIIIAIILVASITAKAQTPDTAFISTYHFNSAKINHFKNDQFDTDSVTHIGFLNVCSDGLTHFDVTIVLSNDNGLILKTFPMFVGGSSFTTLKSSIQSAGNFYPVLTYFSNNYLITPTKTIIFK